MNDRFDENDDRLVEAPADVTTEDFSDNIGEVKNSSSEEYYDLPVVESARTMIWSVISLVTGILAVVSCPLYGLCLILSLVSVGTSLYSRRKLGYFDKIAVFGLIAGIFGAVFGLTSMIISVSGIFDKL